MLKNRICYIIMIIISFWLMLMYEGAFVEAIFAVIVMIPIFLIIVKYITRRMLSCRWVADTVHVTAGKSVKVTSIIYNGFIVPINRIEMKYEITDLAGNKKRCTMVTNLMYWTERKCTMEICPDYSGIITVKLKSVKIYDFFGLTSTTKKIGSVLNISVMPKTQRLLLDMHQQEKTAVQEGDVYSNIFPGNDKTQIFDVSPYHEGDNIKDIHWKLSLKTEEFVVKKYSMPVCSETNVYVDFAVPEDKKVTAEGVDRFYSYVFSIVESLESSEEKVNLYIFDIEGNLINLQNEGEILMPGQQGCRYAENVLDTFGKCIEKGRNILISSRINSKSLKSAGKLAEYYTDLENGEIGDAEILIEDTKIIGIDVTEKTESEKDFVTYGEEMYINNDDEDVEIYTHILRMLIVILGGYVPIATLTDTVVFDTSGIGIIVYVTAVAAVMLISGFIKNKWYKLIYIPVILLFSAVFIGPGNIAVGASRLITSFGNPISIVHYDDGTTVFGLTEYSGYEIRSFMSFVAIIITIVLFIFTWKNITMIIHFIITVPLFMVCFVFGCVPMGVHIGLFMVYLFAMFTYGVTYSNIVKNEKNVLKKAFYESTLNIGALCSYIVSGLVILIMAADISKGYDRPDRLVEMKKTVNEFLKDINIEKKQAEQDYAVGGMNMGQLGKVDEVKFSGETKLNVHVAGDVEFPIYLRGYVGSCYKGNAWETVNEIKNNHIISGLLKRDMSLNNAYNLSYNIMKAQKDGEASITIENVKIAEIVITSADENDTLYYVPYGAYFDKQRIVKDGVIEPALRDEQYYTMYQLTRVDNIKNADLGIYTEDEAAYSEVCNVYKTDFYYPDSLTQFSSEIPWKYYDDNKNPVSFINKGPDVNGYEVYIDCVREYLRDNYEYSLNPGKLEEGEDFFTKFMENKKGYCSHFATMATIMFRLYGIPARYVEGYYVHPSSDELKEYNENGAASVNVDDSRAHAWTEIYINGYGWMPVEVTPGFESLNYHFIDETMIEKPTEGESDKNSNQNKPNETTKNQETTTSEDDDKKDDGEDDNESGAIAINLRGVLGWTLAAAVIFMVSFVFGRKSYKDKKTEDVINGSDYSEAARTWENELIKAIGFAKVSFSVNIERKQLVSELSRYIEEKAMYGKHMKYDMENFEKQLLEMYRIFDRASYGNKAITEEEKDRAARTANRAIMYIYQGQSIHYKLFIKYIKCLYLG